MTAVMEQMIDQPVAAGAPKRKGRSGSAKRQRTEQVKLNLLPGERAALERAAADEGLEGAGMLQAFILKRLAGDLAATAV
ncbi:hypothetical protein [Mycolicibacterium chlorophenolicum]|uniref:Uncharacterized protein n=1 Tax=Mycolicibacterium chlorophenolicum TaxID=37916 RepID=A0A0J6WKY1_9MYCO|nr:hypothetical protein [Mycolicibacterium chlorophenolicum]KMO82663.1 hypothetical protein MCHLDSM_01286 [Mycolicibacterium chlorophenolicum]